VVTSIRNLTILPIPWFILKYQPTIEFSLQSPIGLDIVEISSYMHRS